jgi:hypothetical protein
MPTIDEHMAALDRALDALEGGDLDGFTEIVEEHADPDIEFTSAIGSAVGGQAFRGLDGIRAWFEGLVKRCTSYASHADARSAAEEVLHA